MNYTGQAKTGKLRIMLKDGGITQKELSELLEISPKTLRSKFSDGSFWLEEAKICADMFDMSIEDLFFYN